MQCKRVFLATLLATFISDGASAEGLAYQRAAEGDNTKPGGARRIQGDQTQSLRDSLNDRPAKNVILLIGDGMGDSEITAARNYAEGAGGGVQGN